MFLKLFEHLKTDSIYAYEYTGTVIDNVDPLKIGRIKVTIEGFLEGEAEVLPWIYQAKSSFLGDSATSNMQAIPEIGSKVLIKFPFKDLYSAKYYASQSTSSTAFTEISEGYPEKYGFKDSSGLSVIQDKATKTIKITDGNNNIYELKDTIKITHASGTIIEVKADGSVEITSKGDVKASADDKGGLVVGKDGKVALGNSAGTATGPQGVTELVAILEKLCELLSTDTYAGFGAVAGFASIYAQLQADLTSIKGSL